MLTIHSFRIRMCVIYEEWQEIQMDTTELYGTERISRILFKLAPPVMLAQLIQALYNIVDDSWDFVDKTGDVDYIGGVH